MLFVVTDGEDNASRENLEQAVKQLQGKTGRRFMRSGFWAMKSIQSEPGVRWRSSRNGLAGWHFSPRPWTK